MLTEAAAIMTDEEIARRVIDGETAVFELLIRRHNQRLYRTTRAILKDPSEAEDAMQEAYVSAFAHLDQFSGDAKFSTWLTKIAVYEALGRLRRRKRMENLPETIRSAMNPERAAYGCELHAAIQSAVDMLPPPYRSVWIMREVEEMTGLEASECLGITEETVKTRLHRARRLLRRRLEKAIGAAGKGVYAFGSMRCDRMTSQTMQRIRRLAEPQVS
jgi:RNA polymerase sigma-70 factor (ECF subfamily)